MSTKLVVLTVFGAATVAAAAAGGYVALRTNASETSVKSESVEPPAPASSPMVEPAPVVIAPEAPLTPAPAQTESRTTVSANRRTTSASAAPAKPNVLPTPSEVSPVAAPLPAPPVASTPNDPPALDPNGPNPADLVTVSEPPPPLFQELTVNRDAVIGIRLDSTVSSEISHVEDKVTARVARDVTVGGHTAIPSGARLEGVVTAIQRGNKVKDPARVEIRFQSLLLPDGMRMPIQTATIYRESEPPAAPAKVGASAVIGGILGAVIGGRKGAIIGSGAGAAGGTAAVAATGAPLAIMQQGTPLTVRLTAPVTVTVSKEEQN